MYRELTYLMIPNSSVDHRKLTFICFPMIFIESLRIFPFQSNENVKFFIGGFTSIHDLSYY